MKILAIAGSISAKSYNKMAVKNIVQFAPDNVEIEPFFLDEIPMFNRDLEDNLPEPVKNMIAKFSEANAFIISTPEYNNMVPGVLKNTMEWMSRSYSYEAIKDKYVAIMGASDGGFGTVRSQNQLLLLCTILGFRVSSKLRLPISLAQNKFNENGVLYDEDIKTKMKNLVIELVRLASNK